MTYYAKDVGKIIRSRPKSKTTKSLTYYKKLVNNIIKYSQIQHETYLMRSCKMVLE